MMLPGLWDLGRVSGLLFHLLELAVDSAKQPYNPRPCSPSSKSARQHVCFAHILPTGQQIRFCAQFKRLKWNLSTQQGPTGSHRRNLDEVLAWPLPHPPHTQPSHWQRQWKGPAGTTNSPLSAVLAWNQAADTRDSSPEGSTWEPLLLAGSRLHSSALLKSGQHKITSNCGGETWEEHYKWGMIKMTGEDKRNLDRTGDSGQE